MICRICQIDKQELFFTIRSPGKYRTECRNCFNNKNKQNYEKRKLQIKIQVDEKKCITCQIIKRLSEFGIAKHTKDGFENKCKECISDYRKSDIMKEYFREKKESGRQYTILNRYRTHHKAEINERARDRRQFKIHEIKFNESICRLESRTEAICILGGKCQYCDESNVLKLCIDHINNNGNIERKQFGLRKIISLIINGKHNNKYQVLCFNCNRKKQINNLRTKNKNDSPEETTTKKCTQCDLELPIGMLIKDKYKSSGRKSCCKSCIHIQGLQRKQKIIEIFGNKCQTCNETDIDILEVDHILNDGAIKRKMGEDSSLYLKLISKKRTTEGLQLLCANCNAEKAYKAIQNKKIPIPIPIPELRNIKFDFADLQINRTTNLEFKDFLQIYHYAKVGRSWKAVYEIKLKNSLIGIIKFSTVVRKEVATSLKLTTNSVLELDRFCLRPDFHIKNLASFIMSKVIKLVKKDFPEVQCLVSFADTAQGHEGTIYKASNFQFIGDTPNSYVYQKPDGTFLNKKTMFNQAKKLGLKEREYQILLNLKRIKLPHKKKFIYQIN